MTLLLLASLAQAQTAQGFAEVRAVGSAGVEGTPWQLVERFRPTFEAELHERVLLATTIEAGLRQGRDNTVVLRDLLQASELGPYLDAADCVWDEHENTVFRIDRASDYLSVDRLYLDLYQPGFDLRLGRQALQWGSALFINPTDPFPQVLFTEPYKPRAGVNAARLTVPLGELNQVQAVVGTNDTFTAPRVALRGTVNAANTDWSAVAAWRQESDEFLTGIDIKGTAGVGFWFEGGVVFQGVLTDAESDWYEQFAVGVDYSFPILQSFIVAGQYVRSGAEVNGSSTGALATVAGPECADGSPLGSNESAEPDPFAPFLTGRDYGLLSVAAGITQDLSANAAWLQNFGDGSAILIPSVSVALPKGFDVSLTAQVPVNTWGDGGELAPSDDDLILTLPTPDGTARVDLAGLSPDATLILWSRYNF